MNDLVRFSTNVSALYGKKRGRKPVFNSNMFYPHVQERELQGATTREFLRFIAEALLVAENGLTLADDLGELSDLDPRLPDDFREEVSKVGKSIENKALSNFAEQSEMIIGKPYYPPEVKEDILNTWEANFQMLCKSAETDAKKDIAQLVQQAKSEGWNKDKLERAVKANLTDKHKSRAELIARTESAKLNSQVSLETYKSIGIEYYTWMTTIDGRERQSHAEMNGLICSVDDPDVYFEENPEDPMHPIRKERTGSMVHMHPGTDFQCRCSMVAWDPYINGSYEVKEAPVEEPEEKKEEPPTPLEIAKEETAKAEKRAENAEIKLNAEQRRREILQIANERHSSRTPEYIQEIQYERANRIEERAGLIPKYIVDDKIEKSKDAKDLFSYFEKKHSIKVQKSFANCDFDKMKGALSGIDSVLEIFKNAKISDIKESKAYGYIMAAYWSTNKPFFLRFSNVFMGNSYKFTDSSFHPKGMSAKASAIHEMGHIVNYWIAKKESLVQNYESIARDIVEKAAFAAGYKNFSYFELRTIRKTISDYADMSYKYTETIAESFADVFVNRSRAQNLSKQIYKLVKERSMPLGI